MSFINSPQQRPGSQRPYLRFGNLSVSRVAGTLSLVIALALNLILVGCSRHAPIAEPAPMVLNDDGKLHIPDASPLRSKLVVQAVASKNMPQELAVPAAVEADPARTIAILPPLSGRIVELKVGLGDRVVRGQVLMTIASGDAAQAFADVDKARDAFDLARKQRDRAQQVLKAGGEATKDIEAAQSTYAQAQAELDRADARLKSLGGSGSSPGQARTINVTAPIGGSITTLSVAAGQFINDTSAVAMTVANLDHVWITANVSEDQIGDIVKGQDAGVVLAAYPHQILHGKVQFVDDIVAADTHRGKVRIAFDNADRKLKPNMYATATFAVVQPAQVFVPQSALLMNNDNTSVFVEVAPWTFERRTVTLGADDGSAVRVLSGLKAGERVVIKNGVLIND